MPPEDRFVCRFAAEPPQDGLPSGRWADTLTAEFLEACLRIDSDGEDLGEAGVPNWYPDRTWNGRTYVPVTARTTTNLEVFGYVSFVPGDPDGQRRRAGAERLRRQRRLHRRARREPPGVADGPLRRGDRHLARRGRQHAPT